jgi:hypothetical protein
MPTIRKTKVEFEGRIEEREVIVEPERVQGWGRDTRHPLGRFLRAAQSGQAP